MFLKKAQLHSKHHLLPYFTDHNLPNKWPACWESGQLGFVAALEIAAPVCRAICYALHVDIFIIMRVN
jgi:hypothetical protein